MKRQVARLERITLVDRRRLARLPRPSALEARLRIKIEDQRQVRLRSHDYETLERRDIAKPRSDQPRPDKRGSNP